MGKSINIETYESPKCEIVELLSKDPLLIPSGLDVTGPGDGEHWEDDPDSNKDFF